MHTTHAVCSRHFQPYNGGMKLYVNKTTTTCNKATNSSMFLNISNYIHLKITEYNIIFLLLIAYNANLPNITSAQAYDKVWISTLKQNYGVEILRHKHIQCRVCACTSIESISIYSKNNSQLKLENLINTFLPIKVNIFKYNLFNFPLKLVM